MFWNRKKPASQVKQPTSSATDGAPASPTPQQSLLTDLRADLDEALRWLERGVKGELRAFQFFHDLTKALCQAGLTGEATRVTTQARNLIALVQKEPNEAIRGEAFGYAFKALAITESIEEIRRVLVDGTRIAKLQLTDSDAGGMLWVASESVLDATEDVSKALALISGIVDGTPQKDYAYKDVCEALVRIGRMQESVELAARISDGPPDHRRSFALTDCVRTLSERGSVDDGLKVAQQIQEDGCRSSALFAVAESLATVGRAEEARGVLAQALAIPQQRRSSQEFAFLSAATIKAAVGNFDEALATANHIERHRPRYSSAIANICRVVASKGDLPQALTLANKADNRDVATLGVVQGLIGAGLLKEAEDVLKSIRDEEQRWEGWETLALRLASDAKVEDAVRIADRFPKRYQGDNVIRSLAVALAKQGKYPDARKIVLQRWRSAPGSRVEVMAAMWTASQSAPSKRKP